MSPQEKLERLKKKKVVETFFKIGKVGARLKLVFDDGTQLTCGTNSGLVPDHSQWENRTIFAVNNDIIYEAVTTVKNPHK